MSCTICGKSTGPGAMLCRPCKAAIKRARQFTVLEIPGTAPMVTMPGLPLDPPRRSRRTVSRTPPHRARPARAGLVALAVAAVLALTAYLAHSDNAVRASLRAPRLAPAPPAAAVTDGVSNPERMSGLAPAGSASTQ
jgi:hypothetical protein